MVVCDVCCFGFSGSIAGRRLPCFRWAGFSIRWRWRHHVLPWQVEASWRAGMAGLMAVGLFVHPFAASDGLLCLPLFCELCCHTLLCVRFIYYGDGGLLRPGRPKGLPWAGPCRCWAVGAGGTGPRLCAFRARGRPRARPGPAPVPVGPAAAPAGWRVGASALPRDACAAGARGARLAAPAGGPRRRGCAGLPCLGLAGWAEARLSRAAPGGRGPARPAAGWAGGWLP